ncbi:MAG: hypothetical protein Kow0090_02990 [Myxococcota bacterium]
MVFQKVREDALDDEIFFEALRAEGAGEKYFSHTPLTDFLDEMILTEYLWGRNNRHWVFISPIELTSNSNNGFWSLNFCANR